MRGCLSRVLLLATALVFTTGCAPLSRAYNDLVLGNRIHGLPCEELPAAEDVRAVVTAHQDMVEQIEAVDPGHVFVEIDEASCPGRADIRIGFPGRDQRQAIEAILNSDTFFGVPYRLINQ